MVGRVSGEWLLEEVLLVTLVIRMKTATSQWQKLMNGKLHILWQQVNILL